MRVGVGFIGLLVGLLVGRLVGWLVGCRLVGLSTDRFVAGEVEVVDHVSETQLQVAENLNFSAQCSKGNLNPAKII